MSSRPGKPTAGSAHPSLVSRLSRAARVQLRRGTRFVCPCCGSGFRRFDPGPGGRPDAACPRCGSLERNRVLALMLRTWLEQESPRDILHFAPEGVIRRLLERPGVGYAGADLDPDPGDLRVDIQALPFADGSFDLIVCSHVLEHVPDDRLAMRELRRVLRPGGAALLQHPIDHSLEATIEDPGETDPAERLRRFGQDDHVRRYADDIVVRLEQAGFAVERREGRALPRELRRLHRLEEPWEPRASGSDVLVCRPR